MYGLLYQKLLQNLNMRWCLHTIFMILKLSSARFLVGVVKAVLGHYNERRH